MAFHAVSVRVMIASPSDVPVARDAVEQAPHDWNLSVRVMAPLTRWLDPDHLVSGS
jgi:hypothetical protein